MYLVKKKRGVDSMHDLVNDERGNPYSGCCVMPHSVYTYARLTRKKAKKGGSVGHHTYFSISILYLLWSCLILQ